MSILASYPCWCSGPAPQLRRHRPLSRTPRSPSGSGADFRIRPRRRRPARLPGPALGSGHSSFRIGEGPVPWCIVGPDGFGPSLKKRLEQRTIGDADVDSMGSLWTAAKAWDVVPAKVRHSASRNRCLVNLFTRGGGANPLTLSPCRIRIIGGVLPALTNQLLVAQQSQRGDQQQSANHVEQKRVAEPAQPIQVVHLDPGMDGTENQQ